MRDLGASADSQVQEITLAPCPSTFMFDNLEQAGAVEAGIYCRPKSRRSPAIDSLKRSKHGLSNHSRPEASINRAGLEQAVGCLR